ncbi:MAG TPA: AAA family ATPase [Verrucomicrobiae bacterium]|nr:AAA family ATPase [Verrucomicrobiae bacterium]
MMRKTTVLVSGRDQPAAEGVLRTFEGLNDIEVVVPPGAEANLDPLYGLATQPDVLVAVLGSRAEETLRALSARPVAQRPGIIIVGPAGDSSLMRRSMQAGARDFFSPPIPHTELLSMVRTIGREKGAGGPVAKGVLTAVINAKGGSGASFLAANLAHVTAVHKKAPVALIDLDVQFGALPLAFDLEQRNSLIEALNGAHQLDAAALQGYMARHASGVHVLSAMSDQLPLPWELQTDSLAQVLTLAMQTYGNVIVDLPRQIDPLTSLVLSQASRIALVMQQSLAHVRDAKRLLRIVTASLSVPRENVLLVLNRYNERDAVRIKDIEETVNPPAIALIPNDFRAVSESLNAGVPLLEASRTAPVTRAVQELATKLCGVSSDVAAVEATGPRRRLFGSRS